MRPPRLHCFANPAPALAEPTATSIPSPTMDTINSAKVTDTGVNDGISPAIVRAEVMLDRVHASPGEIVAHDGMRPAVISDIGSMDDMPGCFERVQNRSGAARRIGDGPRHAFDF
jgi:hypothetical protein